VLLANPDPEVRASGRVHHAFHLLLPSKRLRLIHPALSKEAVMMMMMMMMMMVIIIKEYINNVHNIAF
jgi:stage III sporulation protein SpoIIIAA